MRPYDKIMFKTIKDAGYIYKLYPGEFQYADSIMCGYYAIYIAKQLQHVQSGDEVFPIVKNAFGTTADDNDINILLKYFKLTPV